MPTNANTFNSRVTSEALEAKFRQVFPAQGGAELVQDLYASGVVQPVIDFSSVAEGSVLAANLQTAYDFSVGEYIAKNATVTVISNTGFWKVSVRTVGDFNPNNHDVSLNITDGLSTKPIWTLEGLNTGGSSQGYNEEIVVFLRAGDSLTASSNNAACGIMGNYRQIADVSGNLVNPLGFVFS